MAAVAEQIVGRDTELEVLARFLDAVPAGPTGLLIEGEAGIGKTTLWKSALADAAERSYRVLAARPTEAETALPFAGLGDLLEEVSKETLARLPDPQHRAVEIALLRAEAEGPPMHRRAVSLGLLGVLHSLAQASPVVVAVDDAQWLDRPSANALAFAARRLKEEPIGLLVAHRLEDGRQIPLNLEGALPEGRLDRLPVGPLAIDVLDHLLRARLDVQLKRPVFVRLHGASGGNPFFALEIARTLLARERPLDPEQPLPVPENLRELVRKRLARLPAPAREAALVASALSRPTVALVEAALAGRTRTMALEKAIDAGVLQLEGERLRFTHPLLATVAYGDVGAGRRRGLHARLAAIIEDPEERARHLALAAQKPDAEVAAALDEAARRARARGAPDAAAGLWEQARRLTPAGHSGDLRRRGAEAADCHFEAGDPERARELLEEVVASSPQGPERARALTRLAWVRAYSEGHHVAAELFAAAQKDAGDDLSVRIAVERGLAWSTHELGDLPGADAHARRAVATAEELGDAAGLAGALAESAFMVMLRGRGVPAATMERALALEGSSEWEQILGRPSCLYALMLQYTGEPDAARAMLEALYREALERGDEHAIPHLLFHLAHLECQSGNVEQAAAYAEECHQTMVLSGQEQGRPFSLAAKAFVDSHLGLVEQTRAETDEGLPLALRMGSLPAYFELLSIRGFLELSAGDPAEAQRFLGPLAEAAEESGFAEPAHLRFHPNAVEALLALGRIEEATTLLAELEDRGQALGRVWALATASRCRALLSAALGDLGAAYDSLDRAFDLHERLPEPFELGRTLLVRGTIERRDRKKRAARTSLERALEIFDHVRARLWAERARAELARIGGRAPAGRKLTPTEERVAELIAAGRTYQEVADALFMSPKTVQWNLSRIYRKLGVRSRAQLAAQFAEERRSSPEPEPGVTQSPSP